MIYRFLYKINGIQQAVEIVHIGHSRDVYRQ